uniref:NB-ARC domain-containing protein n=1 Tax=Solanum lycopersicum TaxID=4081 RepID=A0A3Q7IQJ5_SOLLC
MEIPESIGDIMTLKSIGISWCGSGVETSAKKIQQSLRNYELQVKISRNKELRKLFQEVDIIKY